jgi:hypothetical protein
MRAPPNGSGPPRGAALNTADHAATTTASGIVDQGGDVAETVCRILGADVPEFRGLPALVKDLRRLGWAARCVLDHVDDGLLDSDRAGELLGALHEAAATHPLGDIARQAVMREVLDWMLEPPPPLGPDLAAEQLRKAGYLRCPVCLHDLLFEGMVAAHQDERDAYEHLQQLREQRRRAS